MSAQDSTPENAHVLDELYDVILERRNADPESSYTAKLFARGENKIAQKLGEEAVETVIAALKEDHAALASESADLLYHLLVLWAEKGIAPEEVWDKLEKRKGTSGITEKAIRKPE
ncbi:phosphoribosyl-ATP diphosphatase [Fodinicurvata sediminis]|uniref:phosphoribosyl-ATP diphosphatase n=1 Tax=Fodinicurvata sediminis TaxID=1121832 RepID=UPI0003B78321|nr:phosphoribosyl-ATP diphosphatase [Fodinicurvata sediminis]